VVLDTNVLVSALFWGGVEATVVGLVEAGMVEGYTCQAIIDELTRVLRYPRFGLTEEEVEDVRNYYITILVVVNPDVRVDIVEDDPDDNKVLENAFEVNARFIVTGDRHLLKLGEYRGVKILQAAEFLQALRQV